MFRVATIRRSRVKAASECFDLVVENADRETPGLQFKARYDPSRNRLVIGRILRSASGSYKIGLPEDSLEQLRSAIRQAVEDYRSRPAD
jgi:exosome complex RNA-binding protein Rrp4